MTTEYTTYACNTCGARFAGNLSTKCPMCVPLTEERVREIVRDGIRADQGYMDERVREMIAEALTEKEEHIRRVFRQELHNNAGIAQQQSACSSPAASTALREFVEAADELRTCVADGWSEANRYDAARSRVNVDKLSSQASEAYENGRSNALVKSEAEMSALRLERERLRSELEKASKDMDDIANAWSDGHDPDWFRRVVAVLKRTGRLGGSK